MQQHSSYVTPIPSMHIVLDRSPPSFSRDVAYNPSRLLYGGGDRYLPDGDDAPHQHGTIPPLTYGRSMILTEHDQHFPSHLTRTSAIVPALGIHGTRDYAPDTLCQADDAADVEASMPPYARPLPDVRANTLDLINGVRHWGAQNVEVHNPFPVTSSTSRAEECGGSLMVQHPQLPLHDARSLCTDNAVQMGESTWNTVDRGKFFNPGTLGGPHGFQDVQTFLGSNESLSPFSNWAPPSSQGLLTGTVPRPTCTSIVPNIANETTTNVGTIPLPLHRTALQPGGGDNCERKDGNCHASGKMALLSYSNESWHQEQLCGSGTPTMSALSTCHVDPSNSATFFGHQDGVQRAPNYYDISQSCYPNAEAVIVSLILQGRPPPHD
ncbi:hypothetical protein BKA82DRAFT_1004760 [Pisolithus tinctorius]|nr:hypothetical protein BKA82DRAFT_1004760 [Pisolithus tinctorius]